MQPDERLLGRGAERGDQRVGPSLDLVGPLDVALQRHVSLEHRKRARHARERQHRVLAGRKLPVPLLLVVLERDYVVAERTVKFY